MKYYLLLLFCFAFLNCKKETSSTAETSSINFNWKKNVLAEDLPVKMKLDSIVEGIENEKYGYIDAILVAKKDTILFSKDFNLDYKEISKGIKGKMGCGIDMCSAEEVHEYNYYHPKYHPYFEYSKLHTLQSVTKSIASTLIGIAIKEGKIENVNQSIATFFTKYILSDSMKTHLDKTTIKDVLTMQLGLEWRELGMSLEMENSSVTAMEKSRDWVQFTLDQTIASDPGIAWNYNSGVSQLMAVIIEESTGFPIDEYARQTLFKHLEIRNFHWKKTPNGIPDTEGGLYLNAQDLAKIGLLHIQQGKWNDSQILPENWTRDAFTKQAVDIYQDGGKEGYGYQWWMTAEETPLAVGLGYGNQILIIIPDQQLIGVVFGWNVFESEGDYIFRDIVNVLKSI